MMSIRRVSCLRMLWMAALAAICSQGLAVANNLTVQRSSDVIADQLRSRTAGVEAQTALHVRGTPLHAPSTLVRLYRQRAFHPIWVAADGLQPRVEALLRVVRGAVQEGLDPLHYHVPQIEQILGHRDLAFAPWEQSRQQDLLHLELLLTDALITYTWHLRAGRIDPETMREAGEVTLSESDLLAAVQYVLHTERLEDALRRLSPSQAGYLKLRQAVAAYRAIAASGGWPRVPEGPKLQKGDRDARVAVLRSRLHITGDLEHTKPPHGDLFDVTLEQGLHRFQERHGLEPDGVVGPATLAELNVPVEARLRQLMVNMERWRWLPADLGERHILVNVPNFALDVVDQGQSVLKMRVVVGKTGRPTPLFSSDMTYLVLSPHWYVPPTIALEDKLPLIRKDPSYAVRQNLRIFHDAGSGVTQIDPLRVNWSTVSARNFPYRLRQDPGPMNALGRVKFMFPNRHHVYLHDTPSRSVFGRNERAYSSGCIRLEKPIELAEYLLAEDPRWSREKILAAVATGREQTVRLQTSIPVHLLYRTAWVDDDSAVHFRKDIYGRDTALEKALRNPLPKLLNDDSIYATLSRS